MKLGRATFLGVRGVADATHEFIHPTTGVPHGVIAFTGAPASGKTRVLEAILAGKEAVAPYVSLVSPEAFMRSKSEPAKIVLLWWLNDEERRFAGTDETWLTSEAILDSNGIRTDADEGLLTVLERYEHRPDQGKLEYFPASRQVQAYGASGGLSAIEQRLYRTSRDERKYSFVPRFLGGLKSEPEKAAAFARRLGFLSSTVSFSAEPGREPWHVLRSAGPTGVTEPVDVSELSASEVDAVIFAATATLIELDRSILFVDRPEQHVSPANALAFARGLSALGSDNQLFLSTTSQEILNGLEGGVAIDLTRRG